MTAYIDVLNNVLSFLKEDKNNIDTFNNLITKNYKLFFKVCTKTLKTQSRVYVIFKALTDNTITDNIKKDFNKALVSSQISNLIKDVYDLNYVMCYEQKKMFFKDDIVIELEITSNDVKASFYDNKIEITNKEKLADLLPRYNETIANTVVDICRFFYQLHNDINSRLLNDRVDKIIDQLNREIG